MDDSNCLCSSFCLICQYILVEDIFADFQEVNDPRLNFQEAATMPSKVVSRATLEARSESSSSTSSAPKDVGAVEELPASSSSSSTHDQIEVLAQKATDDNATPAVTWQYRTDQDRLPLWRVLFILYSLASGIFLSILDTSIVATAVFTICIEFESLAGATWVILAYSLTYVAFAVTITRLSDVIGRKITVIACFVIFTAFSVGGGFAQNIATLIACRALQGVGGSGLYAMAVVIFPEVSPPKMMPYVSSIIGMSVAIAGALGPILGGVISQYAQWRWIFWLNGPVGIVPLAAFIIAWPKGLRGYDLVSRRFSDVDFLGAGLMTAASTLLVFGLQEGGLGAFPWSSPVIICTITFGCVCGFGLVIWEVFANKRYGDGLAMILPARIMTSRVMAAGIVSTVLTGFSLLICIFNIPLRFQIVNLDKPALAGLHLLPLLGAMAVGSCVGGLFSTVRNNTFYTFVTAAVLILIGDGLMSTLPGDLHPTAQAYGYQVLVGMGTGITLSSISIMTTLQVDFRDHAVAQGLVAQARVLGGSIGIAASSAIFHDKTIHLEGILTRPQIDSLQTSSALLEYLSAEQITAVRGVYSSSFDASLRVCTYVAAVGLVASLFTWQRYPPSVARRKAELLAVINEVTEKSARENVEQAEAKV